VFAFTVGFVAGAAMRMAVAAMLTAITSYAALLDVGLGETAMMVIARIIAWSFVGAAIGVVIGAMIGTALGGTAKDAVGFSLVIGCVGAPIGAIAGAAGEIVAALNRRPPSDNQARLS
jgi:hypothetical protein